MVQNLAFKQSILIYGKNNIKILSFCLSFTYLLEQNQSRIEKKKCQAPTDF